MREKLIGTMQGVFIFLIVIGLAYVQIIRFPYYSKLSKNNSIRIIPIDGPRGTIFDRNNKSLVSNRLSFDAALIYKELSDNKKLVNALDKALDFSRQETSAALDKASARPYAPVVIAEDIPKDKAIAIEEESFNIDGLIIETRSKRDYLYGAAGSHLFGYLGEINEKELEVMRDYGYNMGNFVGRSGLEKYYETYLRGVDGGMQIAVDNRGRQVRVLGFKEPVGGKDLYLTIDLDMQLLCSRELEGRAGAIVVMNPKTGEILALASSPSFDPNIFVSIGKTADRLSVLRSRSHPMIDRAISGLYAPGSIFKIVIATAALETKKINLNTHFFCPGYYLLGRSRFVCWKELGHGPQDVINALMNSCNVFFYNTGKVLGVDNIEHFAKLFGFGKPTGIDLPNEASGIVPGRLWKRINRNDNWYEGETINYAIGQGYLLVTPIQIVEMMSIVANDGYIIKPHIVNKIGTTAIIQQRPKKIKFRSGVLSKVREGLYMVINGEHGTGKRAMAEGVVAAGKTGTAENPQGITHAWFSGFAPYKDPAVCVVVFLEHGGKGGLVPSEIAGRIFGEAKSKGYL